ncbi:MAG TPA: LamG domain-containing protein [Candidatus Parcubacteria bacterium]|nr:LamG domain-containing protein [Candidatus Parcubacteria bacterium]
MKIVKDRKVIIISIVIAIILIGVGLVFSREGERGEAGKLNESEQQSEPRLGGFAGAADIAAAGVAESLLPKEIPANYVDSADSPIPLLWTDNNQGENLIIQSDRRYYDGSTFSWVYFAITNLSGEGQGIKVKFEFKGGKGELANVEKMNPKSNPEPRRVQGCPEPYVVQGKIQNNSFSDVLTENETNFYKAKIEYPKGAKGEFIIRAKGEKGAWGELDPYYSSNLVGYWSFDGSTINGTTVQDLSGNGNDGTIHGATPTIGKVGQALSFDGVDDYVDCGNDESLNITDEITIEAWVKGIYSGDSKGLICKGQSGNAVDVNYYVFFNGGQARFYIGDGTIYNGIYSYPLTDNQWYYLVFTLDATHLNLYIDGEFYTRTTRMIDPKTNDKKLTIGDLNTVHGFPFHGLIDEVRIYNRALSADEIEELYHIGAKRLKVNTSLTNKLTDGLVGYWSFDGSTINGTTVQDLSGNGNDGTIHGATPTIGKVGQALSFDGVDDYVDCGNDESLNITDEITVSAWVKPVSTNSNWPTVVAKWSGNSYYELYTLGIQNYKLQAEVTTNNGNFYRETTNDVITLNEWQFLVMTYDSSISKFKLYRNGNLVQQWTDVSGTMSTSNKPAIIGSVLRNDNLYYHFNGLIDEVRIYNRALSAEEIEELYHIGARRLKLNTSLTNKLTDGLVGYWSFDGPTINGNTVQDLSGNGNNGTIHGATPTIGKVGQALSFDGVDDYVDCGNDESLNITDKLTIEMWLHPGAWGTRDFINRGIYEEYGYYFFVTSSGIVGGRLNAPDQVAAASSTKTLPINAWTHLVIVLDNIDRKVRYYFDGSFDVERDIPFSWTSEPTAKLFIGSRRGTGYYFNGLIDEVRIYNRALSTDEIEELYKAGSRRFR